MYVTVVLPVTKNCPGECDLEDKDTEPELSVAVGSEKVTTVPGEPKFVVSVTSSMQAITGGVPSTEEQC